MMMKLYAHAKALVFTSPLAVKPGGFVDLFFE